jgi:hypothetical protein
MVSLPGKIASEGENQGSSKRIELRPVPATMIVVLSVPLPTVSTDRLEKGAPEPVTVVAALPLRFPGP